MFSPIHCSLSLLPKRLRQSSPPLLCLSVCLSVWLAGGVLHWIVPRRPCVSAAAAAAPGIEPFATGGRGAFFSSSCHCRPSMVIIQLHARRAPRGAGWSAPLTCNMAAQPNFYNQVNGSLNQWRLPSVACSTKASSEAHSIFGDRSIYCLFYQMRS